MDLKTLLQLTMKIKEYKKYNKAEDFVPYEYQLRFYNAGKKYKHRYMRAANRVGKSYGAAFEMSCHLTGLYPEWWNGRVVEDSGHVYWCIGVDLTSVSKVMQKELIGTSSVKAEENIGTGAIPRDCIELDNIEKDGGRVKVIFIRHKDGGLNEVHFYGSNNQDTLMGQTVKGVWFDEEPKFKSMELYAQGVTRTATTDGFIIYTATPEQGNTELNRLYTEGDPELLYIQSVTWDDCPHLTEEEKANLLAGYPSWQHDMRSKGIPVLGSGAVFPFDEDDIIIDDTPLKLHWRTLAAVDFGSTTDPSVIVKGSYNPDEDKYYLWSETVLGYDVNDAPEVREPSEMAKAILNSDTPSILVVVPHDGGLNSKASEAKGKQLIEYGVNVHRQSFRNPLQTELEFKQITAQRQSYNSVEVGLSNMRKLFYEGRLKVDRSMATFFKEMRSYFYIDNGKPVDRDNHVIDASRYCIMSLMGGLGSTLESAMNPEEPQFRSSDSNNLTF